VFGGVGGLGGVAGLVRERAEPAPGDRGVAERVGEHADQQLAVGAAERDVVVRVEPGRVGQRRGERVAVQEAVSLWAAHAASQFVGGQELVRVLRHGTPR